MSDNDESEDQSQNENNLGTYEGGRNAKYERHGHGKAVLPNDDTYIGEYKDNKRHGFGTYRFKKSKARYSGNYVYNKRQGFGIMIYPDGTKYEGNWCDNMRHGFGKYYYANGDIYDGEWRRNKRNGMGTYFHLESGSQYMGWWKKGIREGEAELIHVNHKFIGTFKKDKPIGKGKYEFKINAQQTGFYKLKTPEGEDLEDLEVEQQEQQDEEQQQEDELLEEIEDQETDEEWATSIPVWQVDYVQNLYSDGGPTMQDKIFKRAEIVSKEMTDLNIKRRLDAERNEEQQQEQMDYALNNLEEDDIMLGISMPEEEEDQSVAVEQEQQEEEEEEEECEPIDAAAFITAEQARLLKAQGISKMPSAV